MKEIIEEFLKSIILKQVEGSVYLVPAITDVMIEDLHNNLKAEHEFQPTLKDKSLIPDIQGQMVNIHYADGVGHGNYHTTQEKWFINDDQLTEITDKFNWSEIRKY